MIIEILFTREYIAAQPMMVIMAVALGVGGAGAFGSTIIASARRFDLQLLNIVLALVVQVPLCFWAIRHWNAIGAAWSELVRYGVCGLYLLAAGALVYRARRNALRRGWT
jgi:O-antigen/teichoic acid export membrane protein